jgi:8-oxo-dGTP pyrophosphatase MutT (NUDIX family)
MSNDEHDSAAGSSGAPVYDWPVSDFKRALRDALHLRPAEQVPLHDARAAAVLIPFVEARDPYLLFTVRTETVSSHKGQISFPGGSIDDGETATQAALREAHEEIGLAPEVVEVLGELDSLHTFVSGFVVTPIVGWLASPPALEPNPAEVARVLEIPVEELTEDIRREPGFAHNGRTFPTEAWIWNDEIIWGVTARILRILKYRLAEAGLSDPPGETVMAWPASPSPGR